jgi:hypothetical protein
MDGGWLQYMTVKSFSIAQVKDIRGENHQLTVWEVAIEAGLFPGSCHTILTDSFRDALGLSNIFVKALNWIRVLNTFQSVKISCNMRMTFFFKLPTLEMRLGMTDTKTK